MSDPSMIERLAREAGIDPPGGVFLRWGADNAALRRFAALVAAECAKEVECCDIGPCPNVPTQRAATAAAIRAKFAAPLK